MNHSFRKIILAALSLILTHEMQSAPLGTGFSYQGHLQLNGNPVNGTVHLRFSLWDASGAGQPPLGGNQLGGSQLLTNVSIAEGVFTVVLNASSEFGPTALNGEPRWLQIEVCADPGCAGLNILSPRQPISAAPYTHKALSVSWSDLTEVPEGFADGEDNIGDPVWQKSGSDISYSTGNVGIGTASPSVRLTVAGDAEIGTHHGDYRHLRIGGGNSSGFIYGSFPRYGDGIHMGYNYYADSSGADQVIQPDGATSRITAGYGSVALGTGSIGQPPVDHLIVNIQGRVGIGTNGLGPEDAKLNVIDTNRSLGIFAKAKSQAVVGRGDGVGSVGVLGVGSGTGVIGDGGVYAGQFFGDINVTGSVEKAAGTTRIDHPLDPSEKFLQHSSVESPEMKNFYEDSVITGADGYATVQLPDYFEAYNRDFHYQLTVIGQFAQAIVSKEIENNSFQIRTDKANVKVSWLVTGVRNDAYAKAHPLEVEKMKDEKDRGKYLTPEVFGKPKEAGIGFLPELAKYENENPTE